jgi:lipoprotein-anchoring transpeptidase ErfK/SrfK
MKKILLTLLAAVLSAGIAFEAPAQKKPGCSLLVDKGAFTLSVLSDKGDTLMTFPVATGEKAGRKRKAGDCKTPEGTFTVTWVQNTKGVLYDYHDGKGKVEAYGPYFIHLDTPGFKAIGIHGTCPERDDRIGTRDSKGCIRLHNADLLKVLPYVGKGTKVRVIPGPEDLKVDADLL